MKSLYQYILEKESSKDNYLERGDIKFTIWKTPDEKVHTLENNEDYQKIEYKLDDRNLGISIDFLLGFKDKSWRLWIGKIGSCSYDDDPYCSFDTEDFRQAIILCLDKVEEFIDKVKEEPDNYIQYYKYL